MSDVRELNVISCYIDKWESLLNEIKYVSTVDLFTLFRGDQDKLASFKSILKALQQELALDYEKYLSNYFHPETGECPLSVINRVLFYAVWMALTRLLDVMENNNKYSSYEYLYKLNIPPPSLFHDNNILSCAELIRHIHLMVIDEHCLPSLKNKLELKQDPPNMVLSPFSEKVDDLLHFIAVLYSYPAIPIYAGGHLVSAEILKEPQLSLLKLPSYTNIICSACKINNLEYGITDEIEQKQKLQCNCVFIQSNLTNQTSHEHISTIRSQIIQRMAFLHGSQICQCNTHKSNCIQDMENIEKMLPTKVVSTQ